MASRQQLDERIGEKEAAEALRFPLATLLIKKGLIEEQEWVDELYAHDANKPAPAAEPAAG